jgi:hypothetical protein
MQTTLRVLSELKVKHGQGEAEVGDISSGGSVLFGCCGTECAEGDIGDDGTKGGRRGGTSI